MNIIMNLNSELLGISLATFAMITVMEKAILLRFTKRADSIVRGRGYGERKRWQ